MQDMTILRAHTPHTWLQLEERRGNDPLTQIQASKRLVSEAFDDDAADDEEDDTLIDDGGMNRRATAKRQRTNSEQDLLWDNQNSIHVFACKDFTQHLSPQQMTLESSVAQWAPMTTITGHGGKHTVSDVTIEVNTFRETMKMPMMASKVLKDRSISVFANVYKHFLKFSDFFYQM